MAAHHGASAAADRRSVVVSERLARRAKSRRSSSPLLDDVVGQMLLALVEAHLAPGQDALDLRVVARRPPHERQTNTVGALVVATARASAPQTRTRRACPPPRAPAATTPPPAPGRAARRSRRRVRAGDSASAAGTKRRAGCSRRPAIGGRRRPRRGAQRRASRGACAATASWRADHAPPPAPGSAAPSRAPGVTCSRCSKSAAAAAPARWNWSQLDVGDVQQAHDAVVDRRVRGHGPRDRRPGVQVGRPDAQRRQPVGDVAAAARDADHHLQRLGEAQRVARVARGREVGGPLALAGDGGVGHRRAELQRGRSRHRARQAEQHRLGRPVDPSSMASSRLSPERRVHAEQQAGAGGRDVVARQDVAELVSDDRPRAAGATGATARPR